MPTLVAPKTAKSVKTAGAPAAAVKPAPYFTPELFHFLLELRYNNNRPWFQANKKRYEAVVKAPMLRFIADFAPSLKRINPAYEANSRSLFRIARDTRFSANKDPYKAHAAAQFRYLGSRDVHAPGFYLHLEPDGCFAGGGIWMPEPEPLKRIREAIARQDFKWLELRRRVPISDEDKLTRPPKGFDKDHPLIEDLKLKSHITFFPIAEEEVCSHHLLGVVEKHFKKTDTLVRFLNLVLGFAEGAGERKVRSKRPEGET
ncbi:MAG: TIGR02453 family protein [Meiothermus sp.]|nr:TIGR02453 family protein [Meiothermus sp.]